MGGISGGEFIVLAVVAMIVLGPEKLPKYAAQLAKWIKAARRWMDQVKDQVGEELGPEAADVDWKSMDPRQYDPRRIVKDALVAPAASALQRPSNAPTPFDSEAT